MIHRNPDIQILCNTCSGNIQNTVASHFDYFRIYLLNAPVASCNVKRPFSLLENIFQYRKFGKSMYYLHVILKTD